MDWALGMEWIGSWEWDELGPENGMNLVLRMEWIGPWGWNGLGPENGMNWVLRIGWIGSWEWDKLGPENRMNWVLRMGWIVLRMGWIGSWEWNELLVPGNGSYLSWAKMMDLCIVGHTRSIVGTRKLPGITEWWCIGSTVWGNCQTSRSNTLSSSDPSRHSHRWINNLNIVFCEICWGQWRVH